jgi:hypothetical protein
MEFTYRNMCIVHEIIIAIHICLITFPILPPFTLNTGAFARCQLDLTLFLLFAAKAEAKTQDSQCYYAYCVT